jgi:regulator of sirC expression with transglutaminase-like and TPR domain/S1-C subfamily serine protease
LNKSLGWILAAFILTPFLVSNVASSAEEPKAPIEEKDKVVKPPVAVVASAESIAKQIRPSLVLISTAGRDGKKKGIGTGFVVSTDGLIVTNFHVIGQGRAFDVELSGTKLTVEAVHASNRALDLAVIKVKKHEKLLALKLADKKLADGANIVAMGNPHGLKNSVVSGVLSGRREIDGRNMLQLAMPIEPGNSGGPVVDMEGNVHGIVTMKSAVNDNLGFAVTVEDLKTLLEHPNTILMSQWQTIGRMDPNRWKTLFAANWQQRGGQIVVDGSGVEFGGRSLCLWKKAPAKLPYEIGVFVRMDDEAGAAGLVFHSDGDEKHYGFYPSNGSLRLSRFDGPSVFDWNVLRELPSDHYRKGKWNHLKVRVEKGKLTCFVNDQVVIESTDNRFTSGLIGLAKFRDTKASFRQFQIADSIPLTQATAEQRATFGELIEQVSDIATVDEKLIGKFAENGNVGSELLRERADLLEKQAADLRRLATDVHVNAVLKTIHTQVNEKEDDQIDLLRVALLIAKLDEAELDVDAYIAVVDRMVEEVKQLLKKDDDENQKIEKLNKYLFETNGYHGNRFDYYHKTNSYISRVIDDRTGLPITLSVLYMEIARRLELKMEGVGLPGHFVVRHVPKKGKSQLIDVFENGKVMTADEAEQIVRSYNKGAFDANFLRPFGRIEILQRVLHNLQGVAQQEKDIDTSLHYVNALLVLDPQDVQSRGMRAVMRFQSGRKSSAIEDLDWILERKPVGLDLERIREMRDYFERSR